MRLQQPAANMPVEQPTKFERIFNFVTGKGLGLTVPGTVLARADEMINEHPIDDEFESRYRIRS